MGKDPVQKSISERKRWAVSILLRDSSPLGLVAIVIQKVFFHYPQSPIGSASLHIAFCGLLCCSCVFAPQLFGSGIHLEKIKLPPGVRITPYADDVDRARSMTPSPSGTVFVRTRNQGVGYALLGGESWRRPAKVVHVAKGLNSPNGVALRDGALYVAEINRILRYDRIESLLDNLPTPTIVNDRFPNDAHHCSWNRTVPIGYRVTLARVERDRPVKYEVFADGWLQGWRAWGRPVDVQELPDGSLLVSDDKAGAIYRISYQEPSGARQE